MIGKRRTTALPGEKAGHVVKSVDGDDRRVCSNCRLVQYITGLTGGRGYAPIKGKSSTDPTVIDLQKERPDSLWHALGHISADKSAFHQKWQTSKFHYKTSPAVRALIASIHDQMGRLEDVLRKELEIQKEQS